MNELVFRRDTCRLCSGRNLELVLQLAPTPPVDAYVSAELLNKVQKTYPLDVFLCHSCGHVQLLDVVSPKILFGSYIYETASSPGLVEHFHRYANDVLDFVKPAADALVIDIGSNDGTLLRFFKERRFRVLGVDPAREIAGKATQFGIETLPCFFTDNLAGKIRTDYGPAAVITANNVFAHADDLAGMTDGISKLLAPDGVFVFEVHYLLDMVKGMIFDFIYHEHLCYHSVKPLKTFLRCHNLELIDVQRTPVKGGSLRCIAQPLGGPRVVSSSVAELIGLEERIGLDRPEMFKSFAAQIDRVKTELVSLLSGLKKQEKSVAGYGASATSTVLIYHFDLGDVLNFIVDDNPQRQNLFSPGYHIPVLSPRAIDERKPDYMLILVWRFSKMIIEQHRAYLDRGGHFILPLPDIKVI